MQGIDVIFYIAVLIMSVVIHEISHGYAAEYFGDKTARYAGRLTLNPLKHLDMFGSIILPLILILTKAHFLVGWAKPVPYNPENLSNRKWGTVAVAVAGILANLAIAIIFGIVIRLATHFGISYEPLYSICGMIVFLNILLAFFNLMPFPPLDGSKILFAFLPARFAHWEFFLERYALVIFILFLFLVWPYLSPAIFFLFRLLVGDVALLF